MRTVLSATAVMAMVGVVAPVAHSALTGEQTTDPAVAVTDESATLASLPSVKTGALPGPAVLYEPAPVAPQLENHDPARDRAVRAAAILERGDAVPTIPGGS